MDYKKRRAVTSEKVIGMLKENTGSHMLDSGGAYGRNWSRNQKRSFVNDPFSVVKWDGYLDVTISLYQYLMERLRYDVDAIKIQRKWKTFINKEENKDNGWLENIEDFVKVNGYKAEFSENSYNRDSLLSQVIQYGVFSDENDCLFVLLQVHGGCDIRGGYTEPKVFSLVGDNEQYSLTDEDVSFGCKDHHWHYRIGQDCEMDYYEELPLFNKTHYQNIRFDDIDKTENEEEKGKGKIYVDSDKNMYCHICGEIMTG